MPSTTINSKQRGFSLVELSVVLVIIGLVVGASAQLMMRLSINEPQQNQNNERVTQKIDQAVRGFTMVHARLPCPDLAVNGVTDGFEDCLDAAGDKVQVGLLPVRSLGLFESNGRGWAEEIVYGVSRTAAAHDLSKLEQRYSKNASSHAIQCVAPTAASACDVNDTGSVAAATFQQAANDLNLLDFCGQLNLAASAAASTDQIHTTDASGTINIAYGFALAGSAQQSVANTGLLESRAGLMNNNFLAPSLTAVNARLDDHRQLRSYRDLFQSLNCPQRLSGVDSVYYSSYATAGGEYLGRINLAAAKVQLGVAESDIGGAERDVTFGTIGIALATADLLISIAELTTLNAAAVAGVAVATAELANAVAGLVLANQNVASAKAWRDEVATATTGFRTELLESGNTMTANRAISQAAQVRGEL